MDILINVFLSVVMVIPIMFLITIFVIKKEERIRTFKMSIKNKRCIESFLILIGFMIFSAFVMYYGNGF